MKTNDNNLKDIYDKPGSPLSEKDRQIKLLGYSDKDFSQKEEEEYRKLEDASYFARLDVDILYNGKKYYKRLYISKDSVTEEKERGVFNNSGIYITPNELREMNREGQISKELISSGIHKKYSLDLELIHWTSPLVNELYDNNVINSKKFNDYLYGVMLKRKFEPNSSKYYNSYIAENSLYEDGTVDEFLLKLLLAKKDSDILTDIIASIQSNQNKIIRTNASDNFIVQGCAGSGKTMILLHRLSYLKFNNLLPQYSKIKIITPNKLFNNFIKDLSEKLKINEIEQLTMGQYFMNINDKYIRNYDKRENISNDFFENKKSKYRSRFDVLNFIEENQKDDIPLTSIYNSIYSLVENEYNNIINSFKNLLKAHDIQFSTEFINNKTNIEYSINTIHSKIENLENKNKIFISNIQTQINDINAQIDSLKLLDYSQKQLDINFQIESIENILENSINNSIEFPDVTDSYDSVMAEMSKIDSNIINLENSKKHILDEILSKTEALNTFKKKIQNEMYGFKRSFTSKTIIKQYESIIESRENIIKELENQKNQILSNIDDYFSQKIFLNKKINYYQKQKLENTVVTLKKELLELDNKIYLNELSINENINLLNDLENNLKRIKDEELEEKNLLLDLKNNLISNVYFSIDLYDVIREKIHEKFNIKIPKTQFFKFDILIFVIINYLHLKNSISKDQLLCIDEAQDYSLSEFKILNKINTGVTFNLYGDINQSIYPQGIYDWYNLCNELTLTSYSLSENYRNSIEVTDFCNKKFNLNIKEMGLSIKNVEYISNLELSQFINNKLLEKKTIAVISKTKPKLEINNSLLHYCSIQEAKGIEYHTVIVDESNMSDNEKYIAYTRALSELYIIKSID